MPAPVDREQWKRVWQEHCATEFARIAGLNWVVRSGSSERNVPDLVVKQDMEFFALEHSMVFIDSENRGAGSTAKEMESRRQKRLLKIVRSCEAALATPLKVQVTSYRRHQSEQRFHFDAMRDEEIASAILALDWSGESGTTIREIQLNDYVRLFVREHPRTSVEFVPDQVGFVGEASSAIQRAIADKSSKLSRYRLAWPDDVRLLLVANSQFNSGKIALSDESSIDRMGFTRLYFLRMPDQAHII